MIDTTAKEMHKTGLGHMRESNKDIGNRKRENSLAMLAFAVEAELIKQLKLK